jgi:hypothetical protein
MVYDIAEVVHAVTALIVMDLEDPPIQWIALWNFMDCAHPHRVWHARLRHRSVRSAPLAHPLNSPERTKIKIP